MTDITPFSKTLEKHGLSLSRNKTSILQINTGRLCNQACKHCHLSAGPDKKELMNRTTMDQIISFAAGNNFETIDITGGAPEMNPDLAYFIEQSTPCTEKIMLRSNLSALFDHADNKLLDVLCTNKVIIVSSFPSLDQHQTDSQRGKGIFKKSIQALSKLNKLGYGQNGSGLELNLVANPSGAFMPTPQDATQKRYRELLNNRYNIVFNNAFTFANVPLGRFKDWLVRSENYDSYINTLYQGFNPCTLDGLMCKNLISVSWDGYLFDCDFNLAAGLYKENKKQHISEVNTATFEGDPITVDNHCYACTAGSGFT